jgi:hypothetical protein
MADEKLREQLQQLHDELERTDSVDEKGREMLTQIDADIQKILGQPGAASPSIRERLQVAVDHFEVDHPAITAALSQMLNTLSNAGI